MLKAQCTVPLAHARLTVNGEAHTLDADPEHIFTLPLAEELRSFCLTDETGRELLRYEKPVEQALRELPATIPDNPTTQNFRNLSKNNLSIILPDNYFNKTTV